MPKAAVTGRRNRKVDPDSPQSRAASDGFLVAGMTVNPSSVRRISAPKARRQRAVAAMSSLIVGQRISVGASANAAQIKRRCAADLEGMALILPPRMGA
jgi:hypothetical protein